MRPRTPPPAGEYVDDRTLARDLRRNHRTLEAWRRQKIGPAYVKLPRGVVYRRVDVERWLASRVVRGGR